MKNWSGLMTNKRDRKEYMKEWLKIKEQDEEWVNKRREKQLKYYYDNKENMTEEEREESKKKNNDYLRMKRREDPRGPMLADARKRAKAKGLEFDLVKSDLSIPDICPVLGIPLAVSSKRSAGSPSLDRVDNTKGYTKENVCVISLRANALKNDATIDELEKITNYMKEKLWHGME